MAYGSLEEDEDLFEQQSRQWEQEDTAMEQEDIIPLEPVSQRPGGTIPGIPEGLVLDDAPKVTETQDAYKPLAPLQPAGPKYTMPGMPEGLTLDGPPSEYQDQISYTGNLYPNLAQQRRQWVDEIQNNPKLYEYTAALVSQEAGDPDAILGVVESLFNRTQQRQSSIAKQITNGFYGPVNRGEIDKIVKEGVQPWMYKQFNNALDAVANGSDLIEGRTDQGMYNEIVGPRAKYGREYFGYMGGDPTWSIQHQRNKGEPGAAYRPPGTIPGLEPLPERSQQTPGLPPGLVLDDEKPQLPEGLLLDEKPSGGVAPTGAPKGQGGAVVERIQAPEKPLPILYPEAARIAGLERWIDQSTGMEVRRAQYSDAELKRIGEKQQENRQAQATENRKELQGAIEGLEKEGYTVPHTIGKPDEPEGDLAAIRDIEELATTLRRKQAYEARTGQFDKSKETAKEAEKWEAKIVEEGMAPWQVKGREFGGQLTNVDTERKEKPSKKEMVDILSGRKDIREKGWIGSQAATAAQRGWLQGQQALEMKKDKPDPIKIADFQKKISALPPSDNFKTFMNDKATPKESWDAFKSDPIGIITELTVESMGSQIPTTLPELHRIPERTAQFTAAGAGGGALAAGPAGGVAGGIGGAGVGFTLGFAEANAASSYISEKAGSVLESLQEAGVDTRNPDQLKAAFANKELMAKARDKAEKKGVPIAYFDGLSTIIGGKMFAQPAKTLLKKAGQWTAELAVQMGLGAGGEAAGQLASEGKITSVRAIGAEAIGELGGGAAEVGVGREQIKAQGPRVETPPGTTINPRTIGATGAAASMGAGQAPFTPQVARAAVRLTPEAPAPAAPATPERIEPTYEIQVDEGSKEGKYVTKNLVEVLPSGKKAVVNYYDADGVKTTTKFESSKEAKEHATKLVDDKNLIGWVDEQDDWTMAEEKPTPPTEGGAPVTKPTAPTTPVAPEAARITQGQKYDAGVADIEATKPGEHVRGVRLDDDDKTHAVKFAEQLQPEEIVEDEMGNKWKVIRRSKKEPKRRALEMLHDDGTGTGHVVRVLDGEGNGVDEGIQVVGRAKLVTPIAPEATKPAAASVPVMITRQMEADLKAAGFTQDQINKMTPAQAHENLKAPPATTTPIEPTEVKQTTKSRIVRDKKGRKGEVVKDDSGALTVDWEDGTQSVVNDTDVRRRITEKTVVKNSVQIVPLGEEGVAVNHYDDTGKKTSQDFDSEDEAIEHATKVAADNNLSGYRDASDNFVRTAGTPVETTTTAEPEIVAEQPAEPAVVTSKYQRAGPQRPKPGASRDELLKYYESINPAEVDERFYRTIIDGKTIRQWLDERAKFPNEGPTEDTYRDAPAAAKPNTDNGSIVLAVNPAQILARIESINDPKKEAEYFHGLLREEIGHMRDHVSMWNQWTKLPQQVRDAYTAKAGKGKYRDRRNGFEVYKQDIYGKIVTDLRDMAAGLPAKEKEEVAKSLARAVNVYRVPVDFGIVGIKETISEHKGYEGDPEGIYDWLLGKLETDPLGVPLMMEVVREAYQSYKNEKISEDTLWQVCRRVSQWFRDEIARLSATLRDAFQGTPSTESARVIRDVLLPHMQRLDQALQETQQLAGNQSSAIQSSPDDSPELKAFFGDTKLTVKNGEHQPQYGIPNSSPNEASNINEFGYQLGTLKASLDKAVKLARRNPGMAALPEAILQNSIARMTMPNHIRIENPVYMKDMSAGNWNISAVAQELINSGYITNQEVAEILDRDGGVTIKSLKELLQKKGHDGITYIDQNNGLRELTENEASDRIAESTFNLPKPGVIEIIDPYGKAIGFGNTEQEAIERARKTLTTKPHPIDRSFIVFEGNQVKSAAGNKGTYRRGRSAVKAKEERSLESRIVEMHNKTGGSSINAQLGDVTERDVYAVEAYPDITMIIPGPTLVEQDIVDLQNKIRQNGIDLNVPYLTMGTWVNKETGNSEIGVSALIPDLHAALEVAEQYNQIAIWYHGGIGSLIYTQGGMGGALPSLGERTGFIAAKAERMAPLKPRLDDPYSFNITNLPPGKIESVSIISDAEIVASAKRGKEWRDWYSTWDKYMRWLTQKHPEYHPLASWFFAASSPQSLVGANVASILRAFRNFVETGDPGISFDAMKSHQYNLRRVVGKFPTGAIDEPTAVGGGIIGGGTGLSGGKVPEFAPALLGDPHAMAVDMHVASILFGTKKPTEWQRFAGQMAIMRISKRMGWNPAEVQAAIFADHIMQTGEVGVLARAEDYMKQYETEFLELIEADQSKPGTPGARAGRSILERTGQRIGPERFLKSANGNIQRIRDERIVAINGYLANRISLTGPKEPGTQAIEAKHERRGVEAKGSRAPSGAPTTALAPRLLSGPKTITRLWNGVKQVFWNSPGLEALGDAVHKHVDLRRKYQAEYSFPFSKWAGTAGGIRPDKKAAINEHMKWREAKAGRQPLPALSAQAKSLKNTYDEVIAKINAKNATLGIKVRNPDTGKLAPIPQIEYPAKIREEVMQAIRDPHNNVEMWRDLADWIKAEKILPANATDAQVQAYLDKVKAQHTKNGAFGRFFFFPRSLPSKAFDYSHNAMQELLSEWTEKMAQVEAFGTNPNNDIFDIAANKAANKESADYIRAVKALAYGETINDFWGRIAMAGGHVATTWHLANPKSSLFNLISGMAFNAQAQGGHFVKAFFQVVPLRVIPDAEERGIVTRDSMNIMADGESMAGQGALASVTRGGARLANLGLKASFFSAAEAWVRGVAMRASESMLRHAIKAYNKNPMSGTTLRYQAYFQRLGIRDMNGLMSEDGRGPLTDEYLRSAVNEIQGGYSYADVPVYMETTAGKALLKYRKWGVEQAKHFEREVITPAIRMIPGVKKETVTVLDANGNPQTVTVPPGLMPFWKIAGYFVFIAAAGAGEEWVIEKMLGIHPKTMRLAEILAQWRKSNVEGFKAAMQKIWQWHLLAGSMGGLGNYIQEGLAFVGLQDAKPGQSAAESIPALDPFLSIIDEIKIFMEQGNQYSGKNLTDALNNISGIRVAGQAGTRLRDVFGIQNRVSTTIANRQDLAELKSIYRRYQDDKGIKRKKPSGERPAKTEQSIWKDQLDDALRIGDIPEARKIIQVARQGMSPQRWHEVELKSLKAHIKAVQPLPGEANRMEFMQWGRQNLDPYQQQLIRRLDDTYRRSATAIGLGIEFKAPSLEDRMKYQEQIRLKQQPTEYQRE